MIKDAYEYFSLKDDILYGFMSEGTKGTIIKIIIFTPTEDGKWNLAFGDWQNKDVDDKVMSNNQDVVRVIGTVAKVTYKFFENYPDAVLIIDPVDEKRKKLYNIVFQRHFETIKKDFKIVGILGEKSSNYSPKKRYDSFELSLKLKIKK